MRLRRQKTLKPTPGRVRTRVNIEVEVDVADVHNARSPIEGQIVPLLHAAGYQVHSFLFEPVLDRRSKEYGRTVIDSLRVAPVVVTR